MRKQLVRHRVHLLVVAISFTAAASAAAAAIIFFCSLTVQDADG